MKKQYILATLFIFIMFGVCFVDFTQAVSITASDLKVDNVGTLPTSNFYFLKQWGRGITRFFTFNSIAKAELELNITNQIAAEALEVGKTKPNDIKAIKNALVNYTDAQERLNARLSGLTETSENPNIEKLLREVDERTAKHVELIRQIAERWNNDPYAEDSAKKLSIGDPDFDLLTKTLKDAKSNTERTFNNATILINPEAERATESKSEETSIEQRTKIGENESLRPSERIQIVPQATKEETSQRSYTETKAGETSDGRVNNIMVGEPNPTATEPSTTKEEFSADEASTINSTSNTGSLAPAQTVQARKYEVAIINFSFSPATLSINKGDTVVWTNNDSAPHDVVGIDYRNLSSPTLSKGQTYSFTFTESGTFGYYCSIHPSMKASVVVK